MDEIVLAGARLLATHPEIDPGQVKKELIHRRPWPTKAEARAAIHDYIGAFFNPHQRHSSLGYLSPMDFEKQHAAARVAA